MRQAVVCRKRKMDHERRPMPHLTADANSTTGASTIFVTIACLRSAPQLSALQVSTLSAASSVSADRVDECHTLDLDQGVFG